MRGGNGILRSWGQEVFHKLCLMPGKFLKKHSILQFAVGRIGESQQKATIKPDQVIRALFTVTQGEHGIS